MNDKLYKNFKLIFYFIMLIGRSRSLLRSNTINVFQKRNFDSVKTKKFETQDLKNRLMGQSNDSNHQSHKNNGTSEPSSTSSRITSSAKPSFMTVVMSVFFFVYICKLKRTLYEHSRREERQSILIEELKSELQAVENENIILRNQQTKPVNIKE